MKPRPNRFAPSKLLGVGAVSMGALLLTTATHAQTPCEYEVTVIQAPLCPDYGWPPTKGTGMNERGDVVGHYNACVIGPATPFLWTRENGFVTLDLGPGVAAATPAGISDNGIIVGTMTVNGLGFRGFVYQDGEVTMLPTVTGEGWSWASAITSDGRYVVGGRSLTDDVSPYNAYIWSAEDGFVDLGVMNGPRSSANDISDTGYVVGWTGNGGSVSEGFVWQNEELFLIGSIPGGFTSSAAGVDSQGTVVGSGRVQKTPEDPVIVIGFVWETGKFTLLDPIARYDTSGAGDINDAGLATGLSVKIDDPNDRRGFIWHEGVTQDLNTLIDPETDVFIQSAKATNEASLILGDGFTLPPDAALVALLLAPVAPLGDLDGDCVVGASDLLILLAEWGQRDSPADLNGDGIVGAADLLILLVNWG